MVSVVRPDSSAFVLKEAHEALLGTVHVGVLVPWANTIVETELPRLGLHRVVFHYARLVPASRTTGLDNRFLRELVSAIPEALTALSRLPLVRTLLACTSAGFTEAGHTLPVVSAFDALVTTLTRMSVDRIVLIAPYPRWLTAIEARAFEERGFAVLAHSSLDREDSYSQVSPIEVQSLIAKISASELAGAQAMVLSCTGWPTLGLLTDLEDTFSIPALSSNLAMAIQAMAGDEIGAAA